MKLLLKRCRDNEIWRTNKSNVVWENFRTKRLVVVVFQQYLRYENG